MAKAIGKTLPLSLGRRVVCDLLHAGMALPLVPVQKEMNIAELVAARNNAAVRPSWCSIFTKAYAKVVAARPELRRAYLSFPWERMHEYQATSVDITAEVRVGEETLLVFVPIKEPETRSLLEIDGLIAFCTEQPSERSQRFRRARGLARWPRFVRRWIWWGILNISAYKRSRYISTFGVTSVGNWGVDLMRPISPCITVLHYGAIDAQGRVTVRVTFDHRVLDGSGPSKALNDMEQVLKTDILAELQSLPTACLKAG